LIPPRPARIENRVFGAFPMARLNLFLPQAPGSHHTNDDPEARGSADFSSPRTLFSLFTRSLQKRDPLVATRSSPNAKIRFGQVSISS
jgi:hypothetical protein